MEVEVILGAPLRYAKELGLTTPVSTSVDTTLQCQSLKES